MAPDFIALVRSELPLIPYSALVDVQTFGPMHILGIQLDGPPSQISSSHPRSRDEAVSEVKVDPAVKVRCCFPQGDAQAGLRGPLGLQPHFLLHSAAGGG